MKKNAHLLILNGPNLNLLGTREPHLYGTESFESFFQKQLLPHYPQLSYYQSNHEGDLIDALHQTLLPENSTEGIILNAGAYTHTSLALADAIRSIATPVVEVHLSNIFAREAIRQQSLLSAHCIGLVAGFGLHSYQLAIEAMLHYLDNHNN